MASGRLRFPILFVLCMIGISAAFAQTSPPPAPASAAAPAPSTSRTGAVVSDPML